MAEKKKAWLYLKARTDEDLKAQKSLLLEYADKAGYEVTEVAADYSPSQSSLKYVRLGAAKHDFEVLLISSWNRLGRDLSETLDTMTELKNQNQRSGGSEDRRAAPGGNRSGRHISASIVVAFEYSFSEKVRVLCVAEQR